MRIHDYSQFSRLVLWGFLVLVLGGCTGDPRTPGQDIRADEYFQKPALLEQAWQLPVASRYKDTFEYQINGAFCGPAALVNVLASVSTHSAVTQENLFDRSDIWYLKARFLGLTLDELAELARDNGQYQVEVQRDLGLEEFRQLLRNTNDPVNRYIINFNRAPLFNKNIGHHSPIGGYLEEHDLVFVLDVLDEYRPFLVPTERLYESMDTMDSESGRKRGLLVFKNVHLQ